MFHQSNLSHVVSVFFESYLISSPLWIFHMYLRATSVFAAVAGHDKGMRIYIFGEITSVCSDVCRVLSYLCARY